MNKKYEEFADEMLKEVTDIKDLTKKELPLIAQEYIQYNIIISSIGMIVFSMCSLFGIGLIRYGMSQSSGDAHDVPIIFGGLACLAVLGIIGTTMNYLKFKFQPRRMAIYAITSLIKGE